MKVGIKIILVLFSCLFFLPMVVSKESSRYDSFFLQANGESINWSDNSVYDSYEPEVSSSSNPTSSNANNSDSGDFNENTTEEKVGIHQQDELLNSSGSYDFEPADTASERGISGLSAYNPPKNPYVNKTVMGFTPYWALSGYYQNYQFENLTIVAYFAVTCYPTGSFVKECVDYGGGNVSCTDKNGWDAWNSSAMTDLINRAHSKGVKVVLVVKNFSHSSIVALVANSTAVNVLINNIVDEINDKNADGVNIDFESFTSATSTERANVASFMDKLADRVHQERPGSHVSIDIGATSGRSGSSLIWDVNALGATSIDAIMVMSYDFFTTSYYSGKSAGPVSPLYGGQYWYTVSQSMADISSKAPNHKVLMGVPYYGLEYPVSGSTWSSKNGTLVAAGAISKYSQVVDSKYDAWHNSSTIQWDDGEKMRWYRYRWPSATSGPDYWQGYYDDAKSLGAKYDYVKDHNLGGIGIWALGYDNGRTELWNAIRNKFSKGPFIVVFNPGIDRSQQQNVHDTLGADVVKYLSDDSSVIVVPRTKLSYDLMKDYQNRSEVAGADFENVREIF